MHGAAGHDQQQPHRAGDEPLLTVNAGDLPQVLTFNAGRSLRRVVWSRRSDGRNEVLDDYPDLERDDLLAALEFGALAAGGGRVVPLGAA
ncbi:MAG TPA: hypothetical protein VJT72_20030 [Pseudonocardiaceae bacterium]|nr:hypothetical protein [Pseudonocardiaceae bacterium]